MVDSGVSKAPSLKGVSVRVRPPAPCIGRLERPRRRRGGSEAETETEAEAETEAKAEAETEAETEAPNS
jgi:hypothetical protein